MKNSWPEVFGVCFVAVCALFGVQGWPWNVAQAGNAAEWAAALATTAAAAIALWFGTGDIRQRREERQRLADTYLWVFVADIGTLASALAATREIFETFQRSLPGTVLSDSDRHYLAELGAMLGAEAINSHLSALSHLDPSIGNPLARLAGRAATLRYQVGVIADEQCITPALQTFAVSVIKHVKLMQNDIAQSGLMSLENMNSSELDEDAGSRSSHSGNSNVAASAGCPA